MPVETKILKECQVDSRTDQSIRDGLCECFPPDTEIFSKSRFWRGIPPSWSVVIEEDLAVLAHVGIVERRIRVGGEQVSVAGPQNVFILPGHRARGFFPKIMRVSMEEAKRLGHDFGLLFCVPQLEKIYGFCKWKLVTGRKTTRVDEDGNEVDVPSKNLAMFFPLARPDFPDGDIHLQGNDW